MNAETKKIVLSKFAKVQTNIATLNGQVLKKQEGCSRLLIVDANGINIAWIGDASNGGSPMIFLEVFDIDLKKSKVTKHYKSKLLRAL